MFAKFSVRKPFTVLVGVILIVVLGVVSFMNTTTDLIPSMNLPYAVVFTTYIGATPEQVEVEITSPIESRMGTVGGISSISSTSNEHVSIIILEFTDTTNMDSASLEIRESLDMLNFPDGAGKPTILRLNPDMMPIMVTSVFAESLDLGELSEFTKNTVAPAFEGIPGVASVSLSGLIQNQLYVVIDEAKIELVNQKLRDSITEAVEKMQAEGMAQFEAAVGAQVAEQVQNIIGELIMQGFTPEEAGAMAQERIPEISGQVAAAMMEAMNADGEDAAAPEFNPDVIGIPAEMLTIDTIKNILTFQNFSMPAGMIEVEGEDVVVRVGDRFRNAAEISGLLIFDPAIMIAAMTADSGMVVEGIEPVLLSDIADVFTTDNSNTEYTRVNGSPAVMITMQKQTEFSTADLTREIREKMDELNERFSDVGLGFAILMDQGNYIDIIVSSILNNLIIGGILAILLLMLFLFDIRPTLVVGVSIPVSLMLAFTAMYFSGVSLNIISMSGLALSVGMLIDNSIVVIDNIYRLRADGVPVRRAAVQGAKEVSGAIVACTFTTIAVFLPIVFTQGLTRQLFTDLGLTIAYALLASLLVALTVVPAASSAVFYKMKPKRNKIFDRFRNGYAVLLRGSLRIKAVVLILPLLLLIASGLLVYSRGMEFFPAMDSEEIIVNVSLPEGTTFDEAVRVAEELSAHIEQIADIEHVGIDVSGGGGGAMLNVLGGMFGMSGAGGMGGNMAIDIYLLMSENRTMNNAQIADIIMEKDGYMDAELFVTYNSQQTEMGFLTGEGISLRITGRELDDLRDTAIEVANIVREIPGAINVTDGSQRAAPELRIRVDKDEAGRSGLTVAQVFAAAMSAINNPEAKINMTLSGLDYEVVIQDTMWSAPDRATIEALEVTNLSGDKIKITDVAEIYDDTGFTVIRRQDGARFITVRGEIEEGYNVTLVNDEIRSRLADYTPREGCAVIIGGESEAIAEAFGDLYLMLALALVFIYLIMVAQFQSLLSPFIVMFTIPLAFTGGFAGLLIANMRLSIVSMIGLILLAGVIVSNGIVFVDCVNRLRRSGLAKKEALIEAGRIRLRPILMTALTTIAAMSTMTIGMGMGTEMVQPMAVTVVGGLLYATLMTLFVVPCMYDLLHRNRDMSRDEDLDYEKGAEATE
jgi:multidrug efflux pump subunit AcrB